MSAVIGQALGSPVTTVFIVLTVATWSWGKQAREADDNNPENNLDNNNSILNNSIANNTANRPRWSTFTYGEMVEDRKYWKVVPSMFESSNFLHLLFTVTLLWEAARKVEVEEGSLFLLRYTVVLNVSVSMVMIYISYLIRQKYSGGTSSNVLVIDSNNSNNDASGNSPSSNNAEGNNVARSNSNRSVHPLMNFIFTHPHITSCSVALGWTTYLALSDKHQDQIFYFFGFWPMYLGLAPILSVSLAQFFLPSRVYIVSHFTGITCGLLLSIGVLKMLPNWYWNACFFFDLGLILLESLVRNLDFPGGGSGGDRGDSGSESRGVRGIGVGFTSSFGIGGISSGPPVYQRLSASEEGIEGAGSFDMENQLLGIDSSEHSGPINPLAERDRRSL